MWQNKDSYIEIASYRKSLMWRNNDTWMATLRSFHKINPTKTECIGAQAHRDPHSLCMPSDLLMGQGNEMIFDIFMERLYMTLT